MKEIWSKRLVTTSLGVFTLLAFVYSIAVISQPQTTPPCCVDRWDPEWTQRGMWGPEMMGPGQRQRMARHWTFMHAGIPPEYLGQQSPFTLTPDVVQAGRLLYQQQCATCHGAQGMGDGDAAKALNPSPALLAYLIHRPVSVDSYLMWSIAEGGKAFGTAMPAFKESLSSDDVWKIIAFMRAGFPTAAEQ